MMTVYSTEDYVKFCRQDTINIIYKIKPCLKYTENLDDLLQNFYLHIHRSQSVTKWSPEGGAQFSTWMYRVIYNFIFNYYGKEKKEKHYFRHAISLDSLENFEVESNTDFDFKVWSEIILSKLKKLKVRKQKIQYSELFQLILEQNIDAEIASKFQMTQSNVGLLKKKLAKIINQIENNSFKSLDNSESYSNTIFC